MVPRRGWHPIGLTLSQVCRKSPPRQRLRAPQLPRHLLVTPRCQTPPQLSSSADAIRHSGRPWGARRTSEPPYLRTSEPPPPNLRTSESPNLRTSIPLYLLRTCELEEVRVKGQVHIVAGAGRVRAPPPESCHCAWRGPSAPPRWAGAHWCHGPAVHCALEGRPLRARTLLPGRSAWSPGA